MWKANVETGNQTGNDCHLNRRRNHTRWKIGVTSVNIMNLVRKFFFCAIYTQYMPAQEILTYNNLIGECVCVWHLMEIMIEKKKKRFLSLSFYLSIYPFPIHTNQIEFLQRDIFVIHSLKSRAIEFIRGTFFQSSKNNENLE